jgi:predicted Zn-ribbon and HTH transcriptional regulator
MRLLAKDLDSLLLKVNKKIQMAIEEVSSPEDTLMLCASTNKAIYKIVDGKKTNLATHGTCKQCGLDFSEDALYKASASKSSWIVEYTGFTCKGCCSWIKKKD